MYREACLLIKGAFWLLVKRTIGGELIWVQLWVFSAERLAFSLKALFGLEVSERSWLNHLNTALGVRWTAWERKVKPVFERSSYKPVNNGSSTRLSFVLESVAWEQYFSVLPANDNTSAPICADCRKLPSVVADCAMVWWKTSLLFFLFFFFCRKDRQRDIQLNVANWTYT